MLKIKFSGFDASLMAAAKDFESSIKESLNKPEFKDFSFKFEAGSVDRLAARQAIRFPAMYGKDESGQKTQILSYKLKQYEIGNNKTCGIVIYPVEMDNGANEVSLSMFNDLIKEKHLGTNKCLQAVALCKMLESQTIYIKLVYYEYIKPATGNIFAVRHVIFTDKIDDITDEDVRTTAANIEAYKEADGNFEELYNKQEASKTTTSASTSRSRKNSK